MDTDWFCQLYYLFAGLRILDALPSTEPVKRKLQDFLLKKQHCEELMKVCQSYSVEQIVTALEQTASKCIYAWKYAYKVLMTSVKNQTQSAVKQWKPRKVIRTEIVPDWFQSNQNEATGTTRNR